jgi:hypothetical protein
VDREFIPMKEIYLYRFSSQNQDTLGILLDWKKEFICFTLEDEYRAVKLKGETRIPSGRYEIRLRAVGGFHEKYKGKFPFHIGMLHLQNVPNFEYILIHCGNSQGDTEGCILVGNTITQNVTGAGFLADSVSAYKRLYPILADVLTSGQQLYITIYDAV